MILNGDGSLYGVTGGGGQYGYGTVYQLIPPSAPGGAWTETLLYSFAGPPGDGGGPMGLALGNDGSLYGPAYGGSGVCADGSCGTVFKLTPPAAGGPWQETIIYDFQNVTDGFDPSGLLAAPSGELFGTASSGGTAVYPGNGTVFALTPPSAPGGAWTKITLFSFAKAGKGVEPLGLVLGTDGNLYGTAYLGGEKCFRYNTCGTVFELIAPASPGGAWTEKTVHVFTGTTGHDGGNPSALSLGPDGTMYGTTTQYGSTAFAIVP